MDNRIETLASEVLQIARGQLLVRLRFLDRAIYELKPATNAVLPLATDGRHMYYIPSALLKRYRENRDYAVRATLHTLLHCLFRHMAVGDQVNYRLWDLACDMAVEGLLRELNLPQLPSKPLPVLPEVQPYTAEKLYRWLADNPLSESKLESWESIYGMDDHSLWYAKIAGLKGAEFDGGAPGLSAEQAGLWKDIAEAMQTDLETFSKQHGDQSGRLLQSLRALNREKTDYAAFLRRFAARAEVMRVSPDEFDYNFYAYGLELYKDMPLIEPLEYRDDRRVRELAIAIDTSGSVAGETVQAFLQKTWNLVKQQETFSRRFVLHIIQCDAEIQEDAVVASQEEFDHYIRTMVLRGFGGTDFRPVFEYVNRLRGEGQLRKLKGLLYFTDGYGTYPEKMPDYQTAFIFLEKDAFILPQVPLWAMRVILEQDEIEIHKG